MQNFQLCMMTILHYICVGLLKDGAFARLEKKLCTKNATASPAKRDGKNDALLQTRQKLHCCQTINRIQTHILLCLC